MRKKVSSERTLLSTPWQSNFTSLVKLTGRIQNKDNLGNIKLSNFTCRAHFMIKSAQTALHDKNRQTDKK